MYATGLHLACVDPPEPFANVHELCSSSDSVSSFRSSFSSPLFASMNYFVQWRQTLPRPPAGARPARMRTRGGIRPRLAAAVTGQTRSQHHWHPCYAAGRAARERDPEPVMGVPLLRQTRGILRATGPKLTTRSKHSRCFNQKTST